MAEFSPLIFDKDDLKGLLAGINGGQSFSFFLSVPAIQSVAMCSHQVLSSATLTNHLHV
jgi:hypothetical protein